MVGIGFNYDILCLKDFLKESSIIYGLNVSF